MPHLGGALQARAVEAERGPRLESINIFQQLRVQFAGAASHLVRELQANHVHHVTDLTFATANY